MSYRNRLAKPSAVLWMFVGVANVVTMATVMAVQMTLTLVGGVATVLVGGAGMWMLRGSGTVLSRTSPARVGAQQVRRSR